MYFSSEEEINDDVSTDDTDTVNLNATNRNEKPSIPIGKLDLDENDKNNIWSQRGIISLSFPRAMPSAFSAFNGDDGPLPISYTTTTSKERLLLLFAENFRRQYNVAFELRRPLILAVPNQVRISSARYQRQLPLPLISQFSRFHCSAPTLRLNLKSVASKNSYRQRFEVRLCSFRI